MKLKKYGKYRQSGVEWLGVVPEHWNIKRLKHVTSTISKGTTPSTEGLEIIDEGTIRFLKAENLVNNSLSPEPRFFIDEKTNSALSRSILQEKDILLVIAGATIGKVAILEKEFVPANTNQAVCFVRLARKEQSQFVWHYFQSEFVRNQILVNLVQSAQPNISMSLIKELVLPLPPSAEQTQISTFLDLQTGRIDALISKKQRLVELLKEKRSALISRAVTKGLDPKVKMKPSGVEWLGEVPEHWKVLKIKFIADQIIDGTHVTPTYVNDGVPFLRVTDIQSQEINLDEVKFISETEHKMLSERCKPAKDDVLLSKNGTIGITKVVHWDWEFSIFVSLCLIKLQRDKISPTFFCYQFSSAAVAQQIAEGSKQTSVINLHLEKIKELIVIIPNITEQLKIIQFLDRETSKLDALISKVEQAILTLKEYRTALISAAVTGKIEIKDEVEIKDEI